MGNKINNINFYSQWSDEELKNVIIPLMGKLGMPELPIEDLRWFDKKDSEAIFMAQSLPKDALEAKFQMATTYYNLQQKQGTPYNKQTFINEIWENWDDLSKLFKNKNTVEESNTQVSSAVHDIINNITRKTTHVANKVSEIFSHIYEGKQKQANDDNSEFNSHIETMYMGDINKPDNSKTQQDFNYKYYGRDGM